MPNSIADKQMNQLIDELCAARASEVAATARAQEMAAASPKPHSAATMKAFCAAGETMHRAHLRKLDAWMRLRTACGSPENRVDNYGNRVSVLT